MPPRKGTESKMGELFRNMDVYSYMRIHILYKYIYIYIYCVIYIYTVVYIYIYAYTSSSKHRYGECLKMRCATEILICMKHRYGNRILWNPIWKVYAFRRQVIYEKGGFDWWNMDKQQTSKEYEPAKGWIMLYRLLIINQSMPRREVHCNLNEEVMLEPLDVWFPCFWAKPYGYSSPNKDVDETGPFWSN